MEKTKSIELDGRWLIDTAKKAMSMKTQIAILPCGKVCGVDLVNSSYVALLDDASNPACKAWVDEVLATSPNGAVFPATTSRFIPGVKSVATMVQSLLNSYIEFGNSIASDGALTASYNRVTGAITLKGNGSRISSGAFWKLDEKAGDYIGTSASVTDMLNDLVSGIDDVKSKGFASLDVFDKEAKKAIYKHLADFISTRKGYERMAKFEAVQGSVAGKKGVWLISTDSSSAYVATSDKLATADGLASFTLEKKMFEHMKSITGFATFSVQHGTTTDEEMKVVPLNKDYRAYQMDNGIVCVLPASVEPRRTGQMLAVFDNTLSLVSLENDKPGVDVLIPPAAMKEIAESYGKFFACVSGPETSRIVLRTDGKTTDKTNDVYFEMYLATDIEAARNSIEDAIRAKLGSEATVEDVQTALRDGINGEYITAKNPVPYFQKKLEGIEVRKSAKISEPETPALEFKPVFIAPAILDKVASVETTLHLNYTSKSYDKQTTPCNYWHSSYSDPIIGEHESTGELHTKDYVMFAPLYIG